MDERAAEILDVCLARLASGTSIDECLATYPLQSAELEAPLRAAYGLMQLPRPAMPATTRATLESQMLARAAARRRTAQPTPWWRMAPSVILAGVLRSLGYNGQLSAPALRFATIAVAVVLALMLSAGTYAAVRTIRNVFIPPPAPTAQAVPSATATPQTFSLNGVVEQIDQEAWIVDGRPVLIDAQTQISGTPAVSATVQVEGTILADGAWLARTVEALAEPTASPVPPTVPPTIAPAPPKATLVPTPFPFPTITPSMVPTAAPAAPAAAPGGSDDSRRVEQNDPNKQCQGQQIGRDDKKCDPKPKPTSKPAPKPAPNPPPKPDPKPRDDGKKEEKKKDDKKDNKGGGKKDK